MILFMFFVLPLFLSECFMHWPMDDLKNSSWNLCPHDKTNMYQDQHVCSAPGLCQQWCSSEHGLVSTWNVTYSNHSNLQNWLMLACYLAQMSWELPHWVYWNLMNNSSLRQSFGAFYLTIFFLESVFTSCISLSAAFNMGKMAQVLVAQYLFELSLELTLDHALVIITYNCRWHPIPLKETW